MNINFSTLDKETALKVLKDDGYPYSELSEELQNDRDIVEIAIKKFPWNIEKVPLHFRAEESLAQIAVRKDEKLLKFVAPQLKNDRNFIKSVINQDNYEIIKYLPYELKKDVEIIKTIIQNNGLALEFTEPLQDNKEIVLSSVGSNGLSLKFASTSLQNDYEVVKKALTQNPLALRFAGTQFKKDKNIVLFAAEKDWKSLKYAEQEIFQDKNFLLPILKKITHPIHDVIINLFEKLSLDLKEDLEVVSAFIKLDPDVYFKLSKNLQLDHDVLLLALEEIDEYEMDEFLEDIPLSLQEEIGQNNPILYLKRIKLSNQLNEQLIDKHAGLDPKLEQKTKI